MIFFLLRVDCPVLIEQIINIVCNKIQINEIKQEAQNT